MVKEFEKKGNLKSKIYIHWKNDGFNLPKNSTTSLTCLLDLMVILGYYGHLSKDCNYGGTTSNYHF